MNKDQRAVLVEKLPKPSEFSVGIAARCWCAPSTEHIEMNCDLAYHFARILDRCIHERWTGLEDTPDQIEDDE